MTISELEFQRPMLNFEEKRQKIWERVEELISSSAYQGKLLEAAKYATGSGKALRPLIVLLIAETFGASLNKALDAAAALEVVHSYSLIHDDLPCMDDDDFRRGKPTVHKIFGEATALLTGDFLLTLAFEILNGSKHLSDFEKAKLSLILAKKAGARGMIGGQQKDLESEGKEISFKELFFLHYHKTALLFTAAFEFGGIVSSASKEDLKILSSVGKRIGLAYQIADDLADFSSDQKKKKATAVVVLGEEKADRILDALYQNISNRLNSLSVSPDLIKDFTETLIANFALK